MHRNIHAGVCEFLRALYGHPKGGDIWHEKIHDILLSFAFETIEGWPGVYVRGKGTADFMVFVLYVDGLLMLGGQKMRGVIEELRKVVEMEDPQPLARYLGCNHTITTTGEKGSRITEAVFDMSDYNRSALKEYLKRMKK